MNQLILEAKEAIDALATFRKNRDRCRDYTFGRQWNDLIKVDGKYITEYEYILREGNIPLKNNLIRRIVRNVLGVFRKQLPEMMSDYGGELEPLVRENSLEELFSRTMEEFLISGMAVHKKYFGYRNGKSGIWTDIVSPDSLFFNASARDIRGHDINLIGQLHDVGFNDWCAAFVTDEASFRRAEEIFHDRRKTVRIIELWRKEFRSRYLFHDPSAGKMIKTEGNNPVYAGTPGKKNRKTEIRKRWVLDEVWRYYFLSEEGTILKSGDTPYRHGSHPYIVKCYPFLDGEIHSFVGDMLDQQRYANRLITLYDWVVRASAKGVLLMPEGCVPPEEMQNVADQWGRFNGVIVYKAQPGIAEPHQVSGGNTNMGVAELLDIQLKMLEDVSGVNGVLQGNLANNSVSGALFNQQTENARTSLSDILDTFRGFINDCHVKDMELFKQTNFYDKIQQ